MNDPSVRPPASMAIELAPDAQSERFRIEAPLEVLYVLRSIERARAPATLHFGPGNRFLATSILALDAERGRIILDPSAGRELYRQALRAERAILVTVDREVAVRFVCEAIEACRFEDRAALSVGIPESLVRIQRREHYRVAAPRIDPPTCAIALAAGEASRIAVMRVLDIGCGGLSFHDPDSRIAGDAGTRFPDCRIALPEVGAFDAALEVQSLFEAPAEKTRAGKGYRCRFVGVPEKTLALIPRYLLALGRKRNARRLR